jgi:hypothetical protein
MSINYNAIIIMLKDLCSNKKMWIELLNWTGKDKYCSNLRMT